MREGIGCTHLPDHCMTDFQSVVMAGTGLEVRCTGPIASVAFKESTPRRWDGVLLWHTYSNVMHYRFLSEAKKPSGSSIFSDFSLSYLLTFPPWMGWSWPLMYIEIRRVLFPIGKTSPR